MSRTIEKILLSFTDLVAINTAFFLWNRVRLSLGFFSEVSPGKTMFLSLIVFGFWVLLFVFFGLYRFSYTHSRTDEFIAVIKTVTLGVFTIFLMTFDLREDVSHPLRLSRLMIVTYWGIMVLLVGFARIILRTVHRRLLEIGVGLRKTLIVGWGKKAKDLFNSVAGAPALGYEVVGFVSPRGKAQKGSYKGVPIKGQIGELNRIIQDEGVQEVLVALPRRSERGLKEVIMQCDSTTVGMKIVPDLYDVIIGQVKTNQLYGFPLIEILPFYMKPWEQVVKRLFDMLFSLFVLVGFLPLWCIIAAAIAIDSKGSVLYKQKRVCKGGREFSMIKFRSMVLGAEKMTGPVWASDNDPRVTRVGRFLRRLRLDEIPQLFNVLWGDMSLVGPRPERPYFVEKLKRALPLYSRRLRVQPGITGWAQVKGEYDQTLENVKQKLEYDLFYLENMSLRMDLKIVLNTLYVILCGRGQ
jgi:exopolysaccharide biosynthesis polyprenyl glycosylphosphotransferase